MNKTKITDFTTIKKLGDGAFSTVHLVKKNSDGSTYAMKKVKMGKLTEKEKQNALNEVRILASIQHPNVIGYKDAFFYNPSGELCIIMEHADNGDLLQLIEKHKKNRTKLNEKQIWHYFVQVVRGLKALHDLKICHRDIKCANLFLTKDGMIKLGDLNVSKVAKKGLMHTQTGTPYYASPEVWLDKPYDNRSDIWSLGCVLYEMITLMPPFRATSMAGLSQKVTRGIYDPIPKHFSADLQNAVKICLQIKPSNRPSCEKILATPGLLNHMTGTLEKLDLQEEDQESTVDLLATIRCPRNLGQITDRLPKSQYQPTGLKRSQSMALEPIKRADGVLESQRKMNQVTKSIDNFEPKKLQSEQKQKRRMNNLPTIQEDNVDDEIVDCSRLGLIKKKTTDKNPPKSVRQSQNYERELLKPKGHGRYNSNLQLDQAPNSIDLLSNKVKANKLNSMISNSESEDATTEATRVSSGESKERKIQKKQPISNAQYYGQDYRTPQHVSSKVSQLPSIQSKGRVGHGRLASLETPSLYEQYESHQHQAHQYNRRNDSQGMSRALGGLGGHYRYQGVGQAIRLARNESKENIYRSANYHQENRQQSRGPCPKYLQKSPSIPSILSNAERKQEQYAQDLHRGLQAVYRQRRAPQIQQDIFANNQIPVAVPYQKDLEDLQSRYRIHQQRAREMSALYERIV